MKKLMEKKPIVHAVIWILIYIGLVNLGDALSEQIKVEHLVTGILQLSMSVVLLWYMKKHNLWKKKGIQQTSNNEMRRVLFYVPLVLLAVIQFIAGVDASLSNTEIAVFCLLMLGTGLLEELIFRGLLFQSIYEKSGVNRAIWISGITFGIGHIVNLLRGYGIEEQIGQIVVAVAVGIVLALLVAITNNLAPGIVFHIVFNIGGSITNQNSNLNTEILIAIVSIALVYAICLNRVLQKIKKLEALPV